jgi:hypothetical protein
MIFKDFSNPTDQEMFTFGFLFSCIVIVILIIALSVDITADSQWLVR